MKVLALALTSKYTNYILMPMKNSQVRIIINVHITNKMATLRFQKFCIWSLYLLYVLNCLADTQTKRQNVFEGSGVFDKNLTISKSRSLKCVPMIKHFEIELNEPLRTGQGVGLTGDHIKLGEWQIDKSLELKHRRRNPFKWFLKIPMCSALRIYYRFFVYYKDSNGFKRIKYWEGQQHSRVVEAYEMFRHQGSQIFGNAHALAVGGGIQNERGWLRREYIIQLKFIWPQHIRFNSFSHFIRDTKYKLKLKAFKDEGTHLRSYRYMKEEFDTDIEASRYNYKKSSLKLLTEQGEFYKPGSIVIFHITSSEQHKNLYILTIYTKEDELLGEVVIPSSTLKPSEGILELPIFDTHENYRVGWLTLPYLRIEALPQALKFNLRSSFHHYWPYNWPTIDIGHRGVGKSFYYYTANLVENTIKSFLRAYKHYGDMVELDVQLTKDYVPIIWHDFGFYTAGSRGYKKLKANLQYVYINELTYEELLEKRVFMFVKGIMMEITHLNSKYVSETERIFPKLIDVYKHLPLTMGIMLEMKWPQLMSSGTFESLQSLDKNKFVDVILSLTMRYSCGRPLIFASFDADICSMIRYKQHIYPVIFQTIGQYSPWESYADLRTQTYMNAINFVQSADILGSAVYAGEFLESMSKQEFNMAFELKQLNFIWGDHLNNSKIIEKFKNQEVAGLIYDRLDILQTQKPKWKRKRFGFFEANELKRIFLRQCIAAGNTSIVEGLPDTHSPFWPRVRSLDEL